MSESDLIWWASFWGRIETWAFFGVVLTLAIEFAALRLGAPYKAKLDEARELQIAQLKKQTADARLELAKLKTPRDLTREQQDRIIEKISSFPGIPFVVSVFSDPEATALLSKIESILAAAKWVQHIWVQGGLHWTRPGKPDVGVNALTGFLVQVDKSRESDLGIAAVALANALKAEGIDARSEWGEMPDWMNKGAVQIEIGQKSQ